MCVNVVLCRCYFCSFVKMGVTLIKYIPQVHMNHARQSTEGWAIDNVLLDLAGGLLSVAQLLISCQVLNDWKAVTGACGLWLRVGVFGSDAPGCCQQFESISPHQVAPDPYSMGVGFLLRSQQILLASH